MWLILLERHTHKLRSCVHLITQIRCVCPLRFIFIQHLFCSKTYGRLCVSRAILNVLKWKRCCYCSCRWCETTSLSCCHQRAYCSSLRWYKSMENYGEIISAEEYWKTRRKTCPSATLPTVSPTWTALGHRNKNITDLRTYLSTFLAVM
jgi:hypothetical protein